MKFRTVLCAALAAVGLACAAEAPPEEPLGQAADSIIGGKLAVDYPEAAYLNIDFSASGGWICSAAIVAPRVVLTAGHCVDAHAKWEVHVGSETRTSTSAATFDWNEKGAQTVNPNHHDVGLVFLDQPIRLASYPTIAAMALPNGSKVTNVGRINNGVATNALYAADTIVTAGAAYGYPFAYASANVIQPGDSGGPDFAVGTHAIVAVNSGSNGVTQILARTDLVRAWILDQIASHGGSGVSDAGAPGGATDAGPRAPPCPLDAEPNDTWARASTLANGTFCGALDRNNEDWLLVNASAGPLAIALSASGDALLSVGQANGSACVPSIVGVRSFAVTNAGTMRYCFRVSSPTATGQTYTISRY